jgi:hypothetical protein
MFMNWELNGGFGYGRATKDIFLELEIEKGFYIVLDKSEQGAMALSILLAYGYMEHTIENPNSPFGAGDVHAHFWSMSKTSLVWLLWMPSLNWKACYWWVLDKGPPLCLCEPIISLVRGRGLWYPYPIEYPEKWSKLDFFFFGKIF